jgi:hypothetical protein
VYVLTAIYTIQIKFPRDLHGMPVNLHLGVTSPCYTTNKWYWLRPIKDIGGRLESRHRQILWLKRGSGWAGEDWWTNWNKSTNSQEVNAKDKLVFTKSEGGLEKRHSPTRSPMDTITINLLTRLQTKCVARLKSKTRMKSANVFQLSVRQDRYSGLEKVGDTAITSG